MSVRSRILQRAFNLLYGPFVFLHEPAGTCLFGAAWHRRRIATLDLVGDDRTLLDLGCGRGHLLRAARGRGLRHVGIDPSKRMLRYCSQEQLNAVQSSAAAIPFVDDCFQYITCTYPGAWIKHPEVWAEIERVATPGAEVIVLLGGNVSRGRGSSMRAFLARLTYGSGNVHDSDFQPPLGEDSCLSGRLEVLDDEWGTLVRWRGQHTVA